MNVKIFHTIQQVFDYIVVLNPTKDNQLFELFFKTISIITEHIFFTYY